MVRTTRVEMNRVESTGATFAEPRLRSMGKAGGVTLRSPKAACRFATASPDGVRSGHPSPAPTVGSTST